jgi:hypothetical protein
MEKIIMSKAEKTKVISDVLAAIAKLALNFTETQVQKKVKNELSEEGILLFLPATRDLIKVLNDEDPNNSAQVKDVVLDWVHGPLADYVGKLGQHLAGQTDNENQKAVALFAVKVSTELLKIYSDDEKDNKAQVTAFFESMLDDATFRALLMDAIIAPLLKRAKAGDDFIELIRKALDYSLDAIDVNKK